MSFISPMNAAEINAVVRVDNENLSPWTTDHFHAILHNKTNFCITIRPELHGPLIGFTAGQIIHDEAEIHKLAITKDFRKKQYAKTILKDLLDSLKNQQVTRCTLEHRASNEVAHNLYKSLNFKQIGLRKKYYNYPQENAIIMALDIRL